MFWRLEIQAHTNVGGQVLFEDGVDALPALLAPLKDY